MTDVLTKKIHESFNKECEVILHHNGTTFNKGDMVEVIDHKLYHSTKGEIIQSITQRIGGNTITVHLSNEKLYFKAN